MQEPTEDQKAYLRNVAVAANARPVSTERKVQFVAERTQAYLKCPPAEATQIAEGLIGQLNYNG